MHFRHILRTTLLVAATGAALVATKASANPDRRIVHDGETLQWPHAYTYYRFVVKERRPSDNNDANSYLRIAELALYDADGSRLTSGLTLAADSDAATTNLLAATYAVYDAYGNRINDGGGSAGIQGKKAGPFYNLDATFDGNTGTAMNGWVNSSNDSWAWVYFTMRLAIGANPVASYNVAFTSQDVPRSWALQASDDHTTWITLDEKNSADVYAIAPSGAGWCNGETPIAVADESAHFFIERGGTLAVNGDVMVQSVYSYGGPVSIASNATLRVDVDAGQSTRSVGGGLAGTGTFEKTGAGTLAVSGINDAFAGIVKASGGTIAFRPLHAAPKFTYYRFVVKDRDVAESGAEQRLKITEIALFDADGNRINKGLVMAGTDEKATTNLLAGTYALYGQHDVWGGHFNALFDGDPTTGQQCWVQPNSASWAWLYFTMRLPADTDVAPAFYNVGFAASGNVRSWALQGSDDRATWLTLDEMDATAVAAIKPASLPGWGNGGTPLTLLSEGDNAPTGEVDAKFIRYTIRAVGNDDTQGTRALCELAVYDLFGKRLNAGLSDMGRNYSGTLPAGSFTYYSQWAPNFNYDPSNFGPQQLFDDDLSTRMHGWGFGNFPDPATPATRISFTMRLPDDATPVASYNFAPFSGVKTSSSVPNDWLVEASRDGTTWFTVDERSGEAATALLPSTGSTYCNGGHPIGFTAGLDRWLCPTGAVVEIANGATLELPASAPNTVSGLAADLTAASPLGTIANFNPAAAGTLYLTTATAHPMLENYALPITFTGLANAANVENWNVVVNGVAAEADEYALGFDENDVLRVTRRRGPTVIYMR